MADTRRAQDRRARATPYRGARPSMSDRPRLWWHRRAGARASTRSRARLSLAMPPEVIARRLHQQVAVARVFLERIARRVKRHLPRRPAGHRRVSGRPLGRNSRGPGPISAGHALHLAELVERQWAVPRALFFGELRGDVVAQTRKTLDNPDAVLQPEVWRFEVAPWPVECLTRSTGHCYTPRSWPREGSAFGASPRTIFEPQNPVPSPANSGVRPRVTGPSR